MGGGIQGRHGRKGGGDSQVGVEADAEAGLEVDNGGARLLMVSSGSSKSWVGDGSMGRARRRGLQGCNADSSVGCTSSMPSVGLPAVGRTSSVISVILPRGASPSSGFSDSSFSSISELSLLASSLHCCFVNHVPLALYWCVEKLGCTSENMRAL